MVKLDSSSYGKLVDLDYAAAHERLALLSLVLVEAKRDTILPHMIDKKSLPKVLLY